MPVHEKETACLRKREYTTVCGGMPTFRETVIGMVAADRAVDLIEEGYDIVIRVDPAMDETLIGRSFLHDRLVVVAAPDLLRPADKAVPVMVRGGDTATSWSV